jgi:hypothetical protein
MLVMNRLKMKSLMRLSALLPLVLVIVLATGASGGTGTGGLRNPCATDADCAPDLYCFGGEPRVCRPQEFHFAHDGPPVSMGKDIPPCQNDSDCPHGFQCSHIGGGPHGSCGAGNSACKSSDDCAAGYHCTHRSGLSFCEQDL